MKHQYFGDINDYRQYGLLRLLGQHSGLSMLVAWMLTPDNDRSDGKFISYLGKPERWYGHDGELFERLRNWLAGGSPRSVSLIEDSDLIPAQKRSPPTG